MVSLQALGVLPWSGPVGGIFLFLGTRTPSNERRAELLATLREWKRSDKKRFTGFNEELPTDDHRLVLREVLRAKPSETLKGIAERLKMEWGYFEVKWRVINRVFARYDGSESFQSSSVVKAQQGRQKVIDIVRAWSSDQSGHLESFRGWIPPRQREIFDEVSRTPLSVSFSRLAVKMNRSESAIQNSWSLVLKSLDAYIAADGIPKPENVESLIVRRLREALQDFSDDDGSLFRQSQDLEFQSLLDRLSGKVCSDESQNEAVLEDAAARSILSEVRDFQNNPELFLAQRMADRILTPEERSRFFETISERERRIVLQHVLSNHPLPVNKLSPQEGISTHSMMCMIVIVKAKLLHFARDEAGYYRSLEEGNYLEGKCHQLDSDERARWERSHGLSKVKAAIAEDAFFSPSPRTENALARTLGVDVSFIAAAKLNLQLKILRFKFPFGYWELAMAMIQSRRNPPCQARFTPKPPSSETGKMRALCEVLRKAERSLGHVKGNRLWKGHDVQLKPSTKLGRNLRHLGKVQDALRQAIANPTLERHWLRDALWYAEAYLEALPKKEADEIRRRYWQPSDETVMVGGRAPWDRLDAQEKKVEKPQKPRVQEPPSPGSRPPRAPRDLKVTVLPEKLRALGEVLELLEKRLEDKDPRWFLLIGDVELQARSPKPVNPHATQVQELTDYLESLPPGQKPDPEILSKALEYAEAYLSATRSPNASKIREGYWQNGYEDLMSKPETPSPEPEKTKRRKPVRSSEPSPEAKLENPQASPAESFPIVPEQEAQDAKSVDVEVGNPVNVVESNPLVLEPKAAETPPPILPLDEPATRPEEESPAASPRIFEPHQMALDRLMRETLLDQAQRLRLKPSLQAQSVVEDEDDDELDEDDDELDKENRDLREDPFALKRVDHWLQALDRALTPERVSPRSSREIRDSQRIVDALDDEDSSSLSEKKSISEDLEGFNALITRLKGVELGAPLSKRDYYNVALYQALRDVGSLALHASNQEIQYAATEWLLLRLNLKRLRRELGESNPSLAEDYESGKPSKEAWLGINFILDLVEMDHPDAQETLEILLPFMASNLEQADALSFNEENLQFAPSTETFETEIWEETPQEPSPPENNSPLMEPDEVTVKVLADLGSAKIKGVRAASSPELQAIFDILLDPERRHQPICDLLRDLDCTENQLIARLKKVLLMIQDLKSLDPFLAVKALPPARFEEIRGRFEGDRLRFFDAFTDPRALELPLRETAQALNIGSSELRMRRDSLSRILQRLLEFGEVAKETRSSMKTAVEATEEDEKSKD